MVEEFGGTSVPGKNAFVGPFPDENRMRASAEHNGESVNAQRTEQRFATSPTRSWNEWSGRFPAAIGRSAFVLVFGRKR